MGRGTGDQKASTAITRAVERSGEAELRGGLITPNPNACARCGHGKDEHEGTTRCWNQTITARHSGPNRVSVNDCYCAGFLAPQPSEEYIAAEAALFDAAKEVFFMVPDTSFTGREAHQKLGASLSESETGPGNAPALVQISKDYLRWIDRRSLADNDKYAALKKAIEAFDPSV